tara:strand:- start:24 stop:554 length:531 start_codon:yes stop_codon:yes gene_type:complete
MIKFILRFFPILCLVLFSSTLKASENKNIHILLDKGVVIIETFPDKAPSTVNRIIELANEGFYDGLTFHRVISGFMAQGGDPEGNGTGGSGKNIKAEFNDVKHERGVVSMARSNDPDSADSQFFICYDSHPFLDGKYTAWGKVIQGMNIIDRIPEGRGPNGQVLNNPTKIITMRVK